MGNIGFGEILVVLLIILIFFGPSRLPEIGKSLGKAIQEFKKALNGTEENQKDTGHKTEQMK